jgi:NhaP-type Na+/H+ or K+/H+ antiporter
MGNPRAVVSVLVALVAVAVVPGGVALSWRSQTVTLINSAYGSIPAGLLLGVCALVLARRARSRVEWTLGRSGGEGVARAGRSLALLAICVALTAGLALGFYGLLTLFAS